MDCACGIRMSYAKDFIFPKVLPMVLESLRTGDFPESLESFPLANMVSNANIFYVNLSSEASKVAGHLISIESVSERLERLSLPYSSVYLEQPEDKTYRFLDNGVVVTFSWGFFIEISPTRIFCCALATWDMDISTTRLVWVDVNLERPLWEEPLWMGMVTFIDCFCESLRSAASIGFEESHRWVPYRVGHHKFTRKIGRVVRIKETPSTDVQGVVSRTIEWESSWFVRGHWRRKFGGIGKSRSGAYTVDGYTWVVPHKKGNKNAPAERRVYIKA